SGGSGGSGGTTEVSLSTTDEGEINVVNAAYPASNPYGAGWSVGGLQQFTRPASGAPILVTAGMQGTDRFDPVYQNGQTYFQDLALAWGTAGSSQILANDGTGSFTPAEQVGADSDVVGTATGDFNVDGWTDLAVADASTLAILLNNRSEAFSAGQTF